jgi:hypothetical protein
VGRLPSFRPDRGLAPALNAMRRIASPPKACPLTRLRLAAAQAVAAVALAAVALVSPALANDTVYPAASRVGLVPPPGMVASARFSGFENAEHKASILLVEMPNEAYKQVDTAFTADTLRQQGIAVETRDAVEIKGGKGVLITGRQMAGGTIIRRLILIANANNATIMANAAVPEPALKVFPDAAVRGALLSLIVRASVPDAEKLAAMPFVLRDLGGMRVINTIAGSAAILTEGPKDEIEGAEQPVFVVATALGAPPPEGERDSFSRRALSGIAGIRNVKVERVETLRLDGQPASEIVATAEDVKAGTPVTLVQWIRFAQGGYIRFVGLARTTDWPKAFPRFRAVRDGIAAK